MEIGRCLYVIIRMIYIYICLHVCVRRDLCIRDACDVFFYVYVLNVHINTYVHTYIHIYTCIYIARVYLRIRDECNIYINTYVYTYKRSPFSRTPFSDYFVFLRMYVTYIHLYTLTHTFIHTHTHTFTVASSREYSRISDGCR